LSTVYEGVLINGTPPLHLFISLPKLADLWHSLSWWGLPARIINVRSLFVLSIMHSVLRRDAGAISRIVIIRGGCHCIVMALSDAIWWIRSSNSAFCCPGEKLAFFNLHLTVDSPKVPRSLGPTWEPLIASFPVGDRRWLKLSFNRGASAIYGINNNLCYCNLVPGVVAVIALSHSKGECK